MQANKRRPYVGIHARKRRAGSVDMRYFLDRRTDWPIINPVLKEQHNDLRSRLSELPPMIIFELDPFLAEPRKLGTVADGHYGYKGAWSAGDSKYSSGALCCNGIGGEIVMVAPFIKMVYILAPNCTLLRKFTMRTDDRTLIKQAWCVGTYRNGNIAVADYDDGRIVVFTGDGRFLKTLKHPRNSSIQFIPYTFTIDDNDHMYVCNWLEHRIIVLDSNGAEVRTIDCGLNARCPRIHDGHLYVKNADKIRMYNLKTGAHEHDYSTRSENRPDMAFDSTGKCIILCTEWRHSSVYSGTLDTTKTYLEWTRSIVLVHKCRDMCLDPSGNIWITLVGSEYMIYKYSPPE